MARFSDKVLVAYFDREEAAEEVRVSREFAALDGRESARWRERKEKLRRLRRVVRKPREKIEEIKDKEAKNPFTCVIEVEEVAEEDEIGVLGRFYDRTFKRGELVKGDEDTTNQKPYPDELISVVEDGSGAVSDRGNLNLKGSKGSRKRCGKGGGAVIAADDIHAVVLTNIAARIRKRQYNAAAETLDRAARLRAGIIDDDMEQHTGMQFTDNLRLRSMYQETARNAIKEMIRLQEPLSRDMLTEEYLREVMTAHNEEAEKKERRRSARNRFKVGKRICKTLLNYGAQAALVASSVLFIFFFINWFLREFGALSDPQPLHFPNLEASHARKEIEDYLARGGTVQDVVEDYFKKDRSYEDFQGLWQDVVQAGDFRGDGHVGQRIIPRVLSPKDAIAQGRSPNYG